MTTPLIRVGVYVDGFNLYYGAVRDTPYRWLDVVTMVSKHLPAHHQIVTTKYCTARVKPRPHNPDQHVRQGIYLRALATTPNLEIIEGHFFEKPVTLPIHPAPTPPAPRLATVMRSEEKGSDVNVAVRMLFDAFTGVYDQAVIVTNDSDLAEPVRLITAELRLPVTVLSPKRRHRSFLLSKYATSVINVEPKHVASSQFPATMTDSVGTFHRPATW